MRGDYVNFVAAGGRGEGLIPLSPRESSRYSPLQRASHFPTLRSTLSTYQRILSNAGPKEVKTARR